MTIRTIILAFIFSSITHASILPENKLRIPVSAKNEGLTKMQYHRTIDKFEETMGPVIEATGKTLTIRRLWNDPKVNAGTTIKGKEIIINLYGGYARHSLNTEDAFMLVLCHELGHHLGGTPKKKGKEGQNRWPSVEGQADYYATLKCLRNIFAKDTHEESVKKFKAEDFVKEKCSGAFKDISEAAICMRSTMAGIVTANISADIRNTEQPDITMRDKKRVTVTNPSHPLPQCRLDTYFQGALCEENVLSDVSDDDEMAGTCHTLKGHVEGVRPRCWFRNSRRGKFPQHTLLQDPVPEGRTDRI